MKYINRYINKNVYNVVYCSLCDNEIRVDSPMYMITNRADETHCYCPDCAAKYMAETLEAINKVEYYYEG